MSAKLVTVCESPAKSDKNNGTLSAYAMNQFIGFNGNTVYRRVRIGLEYGVDVSEASGMMQTLRLNNPNINIAGRLVIEL